MRSGPRRSYRLRRALAVLGFGVLLGLMFYAVDVSRHPIAEVLPNGHPSTAPASGSGVFVQREPVQRPNAPRGAARAQTPAPQAPQLPFSYLGKITEGGTPTILLHGDGKTWKLRAPGPIDERYQVDAIFEDRIVIRYLPLGTEQVLALSAREYGVPDSLRGEYPQD
jgi:hypothetical protein